MPQAVPTDRYRDTALSELVAEPSKQRLPCREILLALNPAGATDPRCVARWAVITPCACTCCCQSAARPLSEIGFWLMFSRPTRQ